MPIYEYRCMGCNREFEYLVIGNDNSVSCPKCDEKRVERQMSACSFKTSGSYTPTSGTSGCSTCSSSNCSSCN